MMNRGSGTFELDLADRYALFRDNKPKQGETYLVELDERYNWSAESEFKAFDIYMANDVDNERRPNFKLSLLLPLMKQFGPLDKKWYEYTYRDAGVTQKMLDDYGDDELTEYANYIGESDEKTLLAEGGLSHKVDAKVLSRLYDYFDPKTLPLGSLLSIPFDDSELEAFIDYEKAKRENPNGLPTTPIPLSKLLRIMSYFQVRNPYWWKVAMVDDEVIDRQSALHNLGLYYRSAEAEPPFFITASYSDRPTCRGSFGLSIDPARDGTVHSDTRDGVMSGRMGSWLRDWNEAIKNEALEVEWMNILYGILMNAQLLRWDKKNRTMMPLEYGLNWKDLVDFIPPQVTVSGLYGLDLQGGAVSTYLPHEGGRKVLQMIDNLFVTPLDVVRAMKRASPSGPYGEVIARMAGRTDVLRLGSTVDKCGYYYDGANMTKLRFGRDFDPLIFYSKLMEYNAAAATKSNILEIVRRSGLSPILAKGTRLDFDQLPESVIKRDRMEGIYSIYIEDLPAVVNTQLLFRSPYARQKGLQKVEKKNYPGIAQYIAETVGTSNIESILSILLTYIEEIKPDSQVLAFIEALQPYLEKETPYRRDAFTIYSHGE